MKSAGHEAYDNWTAAHAGAIPWSELSEETRRYWDLAANAALEEAYQANNKEPSGE